LKLRQLKAVKLVRTFHAYPLYQKNKSANVNGNYKKKLKHYLNVVIYNLIFFIYVYIYS